MTRKTREEAVRRAVRAAQDLSVTRAMLANGRAAFIATPNMLALVSADAELALIRADRLHGIPVPALKSIQ